MILRAKFDYLEESFSYKEVQITKFCLPVKTSCSPAVKGNETNASFPKLKDITLIPKQQVACIEIIFKVKTSIQVNISKTIYLNCGERYEDLIDHYSYTHNLSS